jgi:hypothetical protein
VRLYLKKISKEKKTGGMAQVVEHMPSKCKPLSSIPSTTKRKKENNLIRGSREIRRKF